MNYIERNDLVDFVDFCAAWPGETIPKSEAELVRAGYGVRRLPHFRPYLFRRADLVAYFGRLGYPQATTDALASGLGLKKNTDTTPETKNTRKAERKPAKK
jgi:hypothetical protein